VEGGEIRVREKIYAKLKVGENSRTRVTEPRKNDIERPNSGQRDRKR